MNGLQEYEKWLMHPELSEPLRQELVSIQGNEPEIEDRFGRHLDFGTGGLRGVLGAGLNRVNLYTVRKTSWALAQSILRNGKDAALRGIAIGYDSRHMSPDFALAAGLAMAAVGVRTYVSPYLCATPEVSFTVRHFQAAGGVMITASHNPPEYNGYKVYGPDGAQLLPDASSEIRDIMSDLQDVFQLPTIPLNEAIECGLFHWIAPEVRTKYINTVVREVLFTSVSDEDRKALSVVYTPLHGAGNLPVREALQTAGYERVNFVEDQTEPDGDFPTVKTPNPGDPQALELAIRLAHQVHADIVMGTDPDSDRVGIAVRDKEGSYEHLTGNQVGALLTDFILRTRQAENRLPRNGIVFKTIVSSDLGQAVADSYGISMENTLTGFKYIGNGIGRYERTGEHTFLFGFEESYGYLVAPFVRDKDAVQTCLTIIEMTSFYKRQGKSLLDALNGLFERFGYYQEGLLSLDLEKGNAHAQIQAFMDGLRIDAPRVEGLKLRVVEDYMSSKRFHIGNEGNPTNTIDYLTLPTSDVLKYFYEDGSWIAVRPSGTEPKIKVYLAARGSSKVDCQAKTERMRAGIFRRMQ